MIIKHNITALRTANRLAKNERFLNNSIHKLSSGVSINKAADDSAGLSIS